MDTISKAAAEPESVVEPKQTFFPKVDPDHYTHLSCLYALGLSGVFFVASFVAGALFITTDAPEKHSDLNSDGAQLDYPYTWFYPVPFSSSIVELLAFAINVVITFSAESVAYIHSISLRWSLIKEKGLEFNTNIRLLTFSQKKFPNSKIVNFFSAVFLILGYAATSQIFLYRTSGFAKAIGGTMVMGSYIHPVACFALGVSLLGQILIASLSLVSNLRDIPTWSANPINTTLVALKIGVVEHHNGKSLYSTQRKEGDWLPRVTSSQRQPSQNNAWTSVRWILLCMWVWAGVSIMVTAMLPMAVSSSQP